MGPSSQGIFFWIRCSIWPDSGTFGQQLVYLDTLLRCFKCIINIDLSNRETVGKMEDDVAAAIDTSFQYQRLKTTTNMQLH
jgi:hypothetical protein